jgi:hypothetical protein
MPIEPTSNHPDEKDHAEYPRHAQHQRHAEIEQAHDTEDEQVFNSAPPRATNTNPITPRPTAAKSRLLVATHAQIELCKLYCPCRCEAAWWLAS